MSQVNVSDWSVVAWDTVSPGEWFVISISSLCLLSLVVGFVLLLLKRHYAPVKAKQVGLCLLYAGAGCSWIVGSLITNRLFPQQGPFINACAFWTMWLYLTFGTFLFIDVMIFRLVRLYWIFKFRKPMTVVLELAVFAALWAFPLITAIVATAMQLAGPIIAPDTQILSCVLNSSIIYAIDAYAGILLVLFVFFSVSLRNIARQHFADYRENRNLFILFVVLYFVSVPIAALHSDDIIGRIAIPLIFDVMIMTIFWVTVGPPLFHAFYDAEAYERKFYDDLNNIEHVNQIAKSPSAHKATDRLSALIKVHNSGSPPSSPVTPDLTSSDSEMSRFLSEVAVEEAK